MAEQDAPTGNKADVERILVEFDAKEDLLTAFCTRTKTLIEASLQDAGIQYQSVQTRVKSKKKLREKYLDPTKDYKKLDDITDLAGLRVITYYEDDVDRAAEVIAKEFVIDWAKSIDKRQVEPDRFGYTALNYVCGHLPKRIDDVEYKKFARICCEIQITSILRHAWSEIEHEWYDLKEAYPETVKRRFYRTAALLEIAESEFLDIKKSRALYQRSVAVLVEAKVPDLPIDSVSLRSFIEKEPLVAFIDNVLASIVDLRATNDLPEKVLEKRLLATNHAGLKTLKDIRDSMEKYKDAIPAFFRECQASFWQKAEASEVVIWKGVSIQQLCLLIVSLRGVEAAREYRTVRGLPEPPWDLARQVAVAKETVEKLRL